MDQYVGFFGILDPGTRKWNGGHMGIRVTLSETEAGGYVLSYPAGHTITKFWVACPDGRLMVEATGEDTWGCEHGQVTRRPWRFHHRGADIPLPVDKRSLPEIWSQAYIAERLAEQALNTLLFARNHPEIDSQEMSDAANAAIILYRDAFEAARAYARFGEHSKVMRSCCRANALAILQSEMDSTLFRERFDGKFPPLWESRDPGFPDRYPRKNYLQHLR